ncbi:hypothetical protein ABKV19_008617 [Rosa sericea]
MAKMTAHNPLEEFFEADLYPPMTCRTRFVISSNPEIAGIVPEPDIDNYMKVKNCCYPIGKTDNFVPVHKNKARAHQNRHRCMPNKIKGQNSNDIYFLLTTWHPLNYNDMNHFLKS